MYRTSDELKEHHGVCADIELGEEIDDGEMVEDGATGVASE